MAKKRVKQFEDLRRLGNEGSAAWTTRKAVASSVLDAIDAYPRCKMRLYQQKGDEQTRRVPDFTLICQFGQSHVIEIGRTGNTRVEELEDAGHKVVLVGRGRGFNFENKITPCEDCPHGDGED